MQTSSTPIVSYNYQKLRTSCPEPEQRTSQYQYTLVCWLIQSINIKRLGWCSEPNSSTSQLYNIIVRHVLGETLQATIYGLALEVDVNAMWLSPNIELNYSSGLWFTASLLDGCPVLSWLSFHLLPGAWISSKVLCDHWLSHFKSESPVCLHSWSVLIEAFCRGMHGIYVWLQIAKADLKMMLYPQPSKIRLAVVRTICNLARNWTHLPIQWGMKAQNKSKSMKPALLLWLYTRGGISLTQSCLGCRSISSQENQDDPIDGVVRESELLSSLSGSEFSPSSSLANVPPPNKFSTVRN